MSYEKGGNCWHCSAELTPLDYGRSDTCKKCGRDSKVCKGCFFYDPNAHNSCRENQADRVVDKERSNFCDYFKPASRSGETSADAAKAAQKAAAEALFKK